MKILNAATNKEQCSDSVHQGPGDMEQAEQRFFDLLAAAAPATVMNLYQAQ